MRLTVIGKSPAWEDAGGACSSYLVEQGEYRLLIDCGNGAFAALRSQLDYTAVDAVLISHLHADHFLDLIPFSYALTLGPDAGRRAKPPLLCPPGSRETFRRVVGAWGPETLIESVFELEEYEVASSRRLGKIGIDLHPVPHFGLTHAVELIAPSGGRIVYGADCRTNKALVEAAAEADVLLAEATLAEPDPAPLADRGHMAASEAGALARAAAVGRLVLTHISDEIDQAKALAEAEAEFGGPVEIAEPGSSWEV